MRVVVLVGSPILCQRGSGDGAAMLYDRHRGSCEGVCCIATMPLLVGKIACAFTRAHGARGTHIQSAVRRGTDGVRNALTRLHGYTWGALQKRLQSIF